MEEIIFYTHSSFIIIGQLMMTVAMVGFTIVMLKFIWYILDKKIQKVD